jgi:hypothetical protein
MDTRDSPPSQLVFSLKSVAEAELFWTKFKLICMGATMSVRDGAVAGFPRQLKLHVPRNWFDLTEKKKKPPTSL